MFGFGKGLPRTRSERGGGKRVKRKRAKISEALFKGGGEEREKSGRSKKRGGTRGGKRDTRYDPKISPLLDNITQPILSCIRPYSNRDL